ncbi:MAG: hypothetical protein WCV92_02395 [Candidatus Buchananbacteria bacterium]
METPIQFIKRRKIYYRKCLNKYNDSNKERHLNWWPDINRRGGYWVLREAWTFMRQFDHNGKIFLVERFKTIRIKKPISNAKAKVGIKSYRIGYFMLGKNGNKKNKWTWGESCPIIPHKDFQKLINKAKKEKTIL